MLAAVFISALSNCLMRLIADQGIHAFEIVLFRNVFGLLSVAILALWTDRALPRTRWKARIGLSCIVHVASMLTFVLGLALVPMNESAALTFAGPLFVTIGAALFLGETVRARRWAQSPPASPGSSSSSVRGSCRSASAPPWSWSRPCSGPR